MAINVFITKEYDPSSRGKSQNLKSKTRGTLLSVFNRIQN